MTDEDLQCLRRRARRDGDLSNGAVRLYCEVIDLHLLDDGCFASDRKLSDWLGTTRRTVRRWRNELYESGYLTEETDGKRYLKPAEPDKNVRTKMSDSDKNVQEADKNVRDGPDKNVQHREYNNNSRRVLESGGDEKSTPLPDDHPVFWDYHFDDWQWRAGIYCLGHLDGDDMLNSHYRKKLREGTHPGKIADEWADTFRLLVEQDGWKKEEVGITLQWLFETDNWWRRNRVVQSVKALRKKDDSGTTKFDKILQSALSDYEQQEREQPDPEEIRRGWRGNGASEHSSDAVPAQRGVGPDDFQWRA